MRWIRSGGCGGRDNGGGKHAADVIRAEEIKVDFRLHRGDLGDVLVRLAVVVAVD